MKFCVYCTNVFLMGMLVAFHLSALGVSDPHREGSWVLVCVYGFLAVVSAMLLMEGREEG